MSSQEIRQRFLDYFAKHGHTVVESSSLIPVGDPTLLFTNAGMVQFKDVFLGLERRPYTRATTVQKCMRVSGKHNDLENVGPSPRHHTFFEMLGNFSFGDYFKREAIHYAYEVVTQVYGVDPNRLVFTVFEDDDEAYNVWTQEIGVPPERVLRMGEKTNFWMMGDIGPCGPTSEIHYDWGPEACTCGDPHCSVALDNGCERWLEIWNLVFMQYNQAADGTRMPLPRHGVDTGMGLERITSVVQNKRSNYETDLFTPILAHIQELLGDSDEEAAKKQVAYRVIADHSRAITFLIGDGVIPSSEGRGYVLRLILRRAARYGHKAGFEGPFLAKIAEKVIEIMGHHYRELREREAFIYKTITAEEERFSQTLAAGLAVLEELIADPKVQETRVLPGEAVFRLYDTYGFPLDLTRDVAREHGLTIDEAGYQRAMAEQRERARAASRFAADQEDRVARYAKILEELRSASLLPEGTVRHICYEAAEVEAPILAIIKKGNTVSAARAGDVVEIVLPQTPFYVESGGQVSDTGIIARYDERGAPVWEVRVDEARQPVPGLIVHIGEVVMGTVRVGDVARAAVDWERRKDIMRNHTATHLLHITLRRVLGEHVHQAGSLVAPDRLRFDFTHSAMLTEEELAAIEQGVNDAILAAYPVEAHWTTYRQAVNEGAIALFGEKYGEEVRVIRVGPPDEPFSQELCGGTHVNNTAEIGFFHITSEGSVAAGIRRIEAVTGRWAHRLVQRQLALLHRAATFLGCQDEEVDRRVLSLLDEVQRLQKETNRLKQALARRDFESLLQQVQDIEGVKVLAASVDAEDMETMRRMSDWFRERLGSGVIVLGAAIRNRPSFVAAVTPDLVERGFHAGQLVKVVAEAVGGGGGGRPTLAQAGGRDLSRMNEALKLVPQWVARKLHPSS
ncbi:MAG TPA: alanine--tRNA ligase [Caldilineae bacterium]|nr:alanine--tRNA ligase [Caldilineae bacterium]